jgi:hypothetical protein
VEGNLSKEKGRKGKEKAKNQAKDKKQAAAKQAVTSASQTTVGGLLGAKKRPAAR